MLVGAAGLGKTTLLAKGVMPLLRRRAADLPQRAGAVHGVVPVPDRRSRLGAGHAEAPFLFDRWGAAPLLSVNRMLDESLGDPSVEAGTTHTDEAMWPERLASLSQRHAGVRILLVFDHFEQLLEAPRDRAQTHAFIEAWLRAVNTPDLNTHFLVALDERAWPQMEKLGQRMCGFDTQAFRLQAQSGRRTLVPLRGHGPRHRADAPGSEPATLDFEVSLGAMLSDVASSVRRTEPLAGDFTATLDAVLYRVAESARQAARSPSAEAAAPALHGPPGLPVAMAASQDAGGAVRDHAMEPAAAAADRVAPDMLTPVVAAAVEPFPSPASAAGGGTAAAASAAAQSGRPPHPALGWGAATLAVVVLGTSFWASQRGRPVALPANVPEVAAPRTLTPDPQPQPLASAPPPPTSTETGRFEVQLDALDGSGDRIGHELARALSGGAAALPVVAVAEGADPLASLRVPGRLTIARYDALRAARGDASAPPLRVLAPLYAEELAFIVRADSPLQFIHDLRGRRINIGPAHEGGSRTVREIYARMFGVAMTAPSQLGKDAALAELVGFRSIDAMAIVDAQPSAWLASLDPPTARGLRLLKLDPRHAADRRALRVFRRAEIQPGPGVQERTPTLAVMTFLVASGKGDADAAELTDMVQALCRQLPQLRAGGHPKWRELQPSLKLDTGWPVLASAQSALAACAR